MIHISAVLFFFNLTNATFLLFVMQELYSTILNVYIWYCIPLFDMGMCGAFYIIKGWGRLKIDTSPWIKTSNVKLGRSSVILPCICFWSDFRWTFTNKIQIIPEYENGLVLRKMNTRYFTRLNGFYTPNNSRKIYNLYSINKK